MVFPPCIGHGEWTVRSVGRSGILSCLNTLEKVSSHKDEEETQTSRLASLSSNERLLESVEDLVRSFSMIKL